MTKWILSIVLLSSAAAAQETSMSLPPAPSTVENAAPSEGPAAPTAQSAVALQAASSPRHHSVALNIHNVAFRGIGGAYQYRWEHFSLGGLLGRYQKRPLIQIFSDLDFFYEEYGIEARLYHHDVSQSGLFVTAAVVRTSFQGRGRVRGLWGPSARVETARETRDDLVTGIGWQFRGRETGWGIFQLDLALNYGHPEVEVRKTGTQTSTTRSDGSVDAILEYDVRRSIDAFVGLGMIF